jgi:hypothetical protein
VQTLSIVEAFDPVTDVQGMVHRDRLEALQVFRQRLLQSPDCSESPGRAAAPRPEGTAGVGDPTLAWFAQEVAPVPGRNMPSQARAPSGCPFSPRYPEVQAECRRSHPKVTAPSTPHRVVVYLVK